MPVLQHSFNLKYLYWKFIAVILVLPPPKKKLSFPSLYPTQYSFLYWFRFFLHFDVFLFELMQNNCKFLGWYGLYTQGGILACTVSLRTWLIMALPNFLIAFFRLSSFLHRSAIRSHELVRQVALCMPVSYTSYMSGDS